MPEVGPDRQKSLDRSKTGRAKGTPNKTTKLLKDAILRAADKAGGKGGLIAYLERQARENPGPFLALLGKVLPLQLAGDAANPLHLVTRIERVIVPAKPEGRDE